MENVENMTERRKLKRRLYLSGAALLLLIFFALFLFLSCEREGEDTIYKVYDEKMLDEILEEKDLTVFLEVIDQAKFRGTVHAYGTYTLFAPVNEALVNYFQDMGKSRAADLTQEEAAAIVKYHLIPDTITTADFEEGRLSAENFAHRYLTNKPMSVEGKNTFLINRQAYITTPNLRGANGLVHIIDNVLTPPTVSITEVVRSLPDADYSLLKTLFEESGWADRFNVAGDNAGYTFFIQSNAAFVEAGITTREELLEQLRTNTPTVERDSLIPNFIGYHGINRQQYTLDLMRTSSLESLIKGQVILFKTNANNILVNELKTTNISEDGIPLLRESEYTNLSCTNGVIHEICGNITIKNRAAYRIYWDIAEQPEIMALKIFRKGGSASFAPGELSEIQWGGKSPASIIYDSWDMPKTLGTDQYIYNDRLRFRISTNTNTWMEFKTPVLVGGKDPITGEDGISYKVWLGYRRTSTSILKTTFIQEGQEDQVLPYVFPMSDYMPSLAYSQPEIALTQGWKQYTAELKATTTMPMHVLGIIKVYTTGRHILRFDATNQGTEGWYDMIQFIPVDEDQIWPRVDMAGKWIYEGMRDCEIYPYSECPTVE
jgi:uncharacterized surface protein with fasciclin (FAS1) repeats